MDETDELKIEYHDNGVKMSEEHYKDGMLHGTRMVPESMENDMRMESLSGVATGWYDSNRNGKKL